MKVSYRRVYMYMYILCIVYMYNQDIEIHVHVASTLVAYLDPHRCLCCWLSMTL